MYLLHHSAGQWRTAYLTAKSIAAWAKSSETSQPAQVLHVPSLKPSAPLSVQVQACKLSGGIQGYFQKQGQEAGARFEVYKGELLNRVGYNIGEPEEQRWGYGAVTGP